MKKVIFALSIMVVVMISSCTCSREVKDVTIVVDTTIVAPVVDTTNIQIDTTIIDTIK